MGGRRAGARRHRRPAGGCPVAGPDRRASRVVSADESGSRHCSSATGTWCSSTSPPTTSTSRASRGSRGTSRRGGRRTRARSSSSPTTGGSSTRSAPRTWEVHDGIVEPFEGGYAAYVLQRVERDRMAAASESKRQNLMRKELAWLRRGAPARTSKPKFRIDAANELIENEPPVRESGRAQPARGRRGSARTSSTCSTSRWPTRRSRSTPGGRCRGWGAGDEDRAARARVAHRAPGSAPASSASTAPASRRCSGS